MNSFYVAGISSISNTFIPNSCDLKALSEKGYVKRMKPDTFNQQKRGTIGKSVGNLRFNDTMSTCLYVVHMLVSYFSGYSVFCCGLQDSIIFPVSCRNALDPDFVSI